MYNCILFIGTGQIGKAILKELVKQTPKKIIIHNLTQKESEQLLEEYSPLYPEIEFISSYGNIFLPYELKDVENNQLHKHSETIINYFYNEITGDILSKSTIYSLVKEHKPDLIVDAINSATVLGNAYDPEYRKEHYSQNPTECCQSIMVDDFITKIINFVSSLKYSIEQFDVKKYVKVSTTGIGGMGMNMPYTHGDNPKINLSLAIMGKISASGVLHQLLWNLSHTNGMNISLIIPGTFVGYDSLKLEAIETDKGLLKKRNISPQTKIEFGQELKYNYNVSDEYLQFPVIRAGENHVYSIAELNVLTAIGQMEAITKEEVARATVDCILGNNDKNIFSSMDNAMLSPTYSGREMICDINKKFKKLNSVVQGVATGNLGVTTSKLLYELYIRMGIFRIINNCRNHKKV